MYLRMLLLNRTRIRLNPRSRLLSIELRKRNYNGIYSYVTLGSTLGCKLEKCNFSGFCCNCPNKYVDFFSY